MARLQAVAVTNRLYCTAALNPPQRTTRLNSAHLDKEMALHSDFFACSGSKYLLTTQKIFENILNLKLLLFFSQPLISIYSGCWE